MFSPPRVVPSVPQCEWFDRMIIVVSNHHTRFASLFIPSFVCTRKTISLNKAQNGTRSNGAREIKSPRTIPINEVFSVGIGIERHSRAGNEKGKHSSSSGECECVFSSFHHIWKSALNFPTTHTALTVWIDGETCCEWFCFIPIFLQCSSFLEIALC